MQSRCYILTFVCNFSHSKIILITVIMLLLPGRQCENNRRENHYNDL